MGLITPSIPSLIPSVLAVGTYLTQPKSSKTKAVSTTPTVTQAQGPSAADVAATEAKAAQEEKDQAQAVEQKQREKNLLRRDRGLGGTVQTGVTGLLAQSAAVAPKKTLLGQ